MLWILLRGLHYPGPSTYGQASEEANRVPMPLDPIEVAGNLHSERIARLVPSWKTGVQIIRILHSPEVIQSILKPTSATGRQIKYTGRKYAGHLSHLELAHVIVSTEAEMIRLFGTYFSVPKTIATDRAIFNGSSLTEHFIPAPGTNLADICRICRKFAEFVTKNGVFYGFTTDIRHYFHQLRVHRRLSENFGLACDGKYYTYTVLPMGWTFSPVVAQAAGWSLLVGREVNQAPLFNESFMEDPCLPSFVSSIEEGFGCLYYDNYIVVTKSQAATEQIRLRLTKNIEKCGSRPATVALKELTSFNHKTLRKRGLEFLGCEFMVTQKAPREAQECTTVLHWRILPEKIPTEVEWRNEGSIRTMAERLGKALHSKLLTLQPLGGTLLGKRILELISKIGRQAAQHGWDSAWSGEPWDELVLSEALSYLKSNEWKCLPNITNANCLVMSDASNIGYGWVVIQLSPLQILSMRSHSWKQSMQHLDIFRKEAYAILSAVMNARCITNDTLALIVDNTAVAGVLRRGYSFCAIVARWLAKVDITTNVSDVHTVVSADNATDPLSRNMQIAIDAPSVVELFHHLQQGRRTGQQRITVDESQHDDAREEWVVQECNETELSAE